MHARRTTVPPLVTEPEIGGNKLPSGFSERVYSAVKQIPVGESNQLVRHRTLGGAPLVGAVRPAADPGTDPGDLGQAQFRVHRPAVGSPELV